MLKRFPLSDLRKIERSYGYLHWVPARDEGFRNLRLHVFVIRSGKQTSKHYHPSEEIFFILEGKGIIESRDQRFHVYKNDTILVPPNDVHRVKNSGSEDMIYVVAMSPPRKPEETTYVD